MSSVMSTGVRALTYFTGAVVLCIAVAAWATSSDVGDIANWAQQVLGLTFVVLLAGLVLLSLFSWVRLQRADPGSAVWLETGLHAANGVATLGLTYTLLGIALGIGSLGGRELSPTTIQPIISDLTQHFSLAFMTSVIGLPVAAVLRALIMVAHVRANQAVRVH